jgi:hypothetical protein
MADPINSTLDSYSGDILLQNSSASNQFTLTVLPYASGETDGTFFVGLTQGILTDVTTGVQSDPFYMFCADFNHFISVPPGGTTYDIVIDSLTGPDAPDLPSPPGLGLSLETLQMEALLGANFGATPAGLPTPQNDIDAQHDIWDLSYTGAPPLPFASPTAGMTSLMDAADAAYLAGANYSGAFLFDIVEGGLSAPGQAFMPVDTTPFISTRSITPEPGTLALLGFGLLGLGTLKLRRSRR